MSSKNSEEHFGVWLIEQSWFPFVIMGIVLIGLRLYNAHQRSEQRRLMCEVLGLPTARPGVQRGAVERRKGE
uniref:Uncharacterized protein n=1 Tax=Trypanosoma vivax (strain Y486) TaxID=1055687 RepID=G0TS80_TRYVY|nr:conserved hypothetical protein [Trypanosoma vivax Y486]